MLNIIRTKPLRMWLCCATLLAACGSEPDRVPAPPPPLPTAPIPPVAAAAGQAQEAAPEAPAVAEPAAAPDEPIAPIAGSGPIRKAKPGASVYDREPDRKAEAATKPAKPILQVDLAKVAATQPLPAPKPDPKKEEPAPTSFAMPGAEHVKIAAPKGLQADLAKDTRMQPWLEKGVAAAEKCYLREAKKEPKLSGTIEVAIVMHENDRPDASIKTLPPQLSGLFACLTGTMMKLRMPLFTGKEGQKHTARVTFKP